MFETMQNITRTNPWLRDLEINTVTNDERQILRMSRQEVIEGKKKLLAENQWLQDLQTKYADKINQDNSAEYIGQIIDWLYEKFPQTYINGKNNKWILKPEGAAGGKGITVHEDIDEIIDTINYNKVKEFHKIRQLQSGRVFATSKDGILCPTE